MKYMIFLFSFFVLTACMQNKELEKTTVLFSQSDYFLSKNCKENTHGQIRIKTPHHEAADNVYKLYINEQFIQELKPSNYQNGMPSKYAGSFTGTYDFEIPRDVVSKVITDSMYVAFGFNQEVHESKKFGIHLHDEGTPVSYVKHNFEGSIGVKQYYWDGYNGPDIEGNTKYVVHGKNQIHTYREDGKLHRTLEYQLSLENLADGNMTHLKPNIKRSYQFDPRCNIKEGTKKFRTNRKDHFLGSVASITTTYDANISNGLSPGYQVYTLLIQL